MFTSKGFTLIELLVVIGILGILASALVATIDPFEQFKKAQDANTKNASVEFVNANIRFYTTNAKLPWDYTSTCANGAPPTAMTLTASTAQPCLTALISQNEIKPGFTSATSIIQEIVVSGGANSVIACFKPKSKSQQSDPNTRYDASGNPTSGCASTAGQSGTYCYWCAQ